MSKMPKIMACCRFLVSYFLQAGEHQEIDFAYIYAVDNVQLASQRNKAINKGRPEFYI